MKTKLKENVKGTTNFITNSLETYWQWMWSMHFNHVINKYLIFLICFFYNGWHIGFVSFI